MDKILDNMLQCNVYAMRVSQNRSAKVIYYMNRYMTTTENKITKVGTRDIKMYFFSVWSCSPLVPSHTNGKLVGQHLPVCGSCSVWYNRNAPNKCDDRSRKFVLDLERQRVTKKETRNALWSKLKGNIAHDVTQEYLIKKTHTNTVTVPCAHSFPGHTTTKRTLTCVNLSAETEDRA